MFLNQKVMVRKVQDECKWVYGVLFNKLKKGHKALVTTSRGETMVLGEIANIVINEPWRIITLYTDKGKFEVSPESQALPMNKMVAND